MNVTCPECATVFRVDPAKVPAGGVRARCSVCRAVFPVVAAEVVSAAPPAFVLPLPPPPPPPLVKVVAPPAQVPLAAPAVPARPAFAAPTAPPPIARPAAPGLPLRPSMPAVPLAPIALAPVAPPPPPLAVPIPAPVAAPPVPPPAPKPAGAATRVINPFLQKDPVTKAQRLARALVSDMVSYHPAKRAQGLKDGTLKEIFREEVKKSYEEYVLQIGEPLAGSTTFFQDALNEILAGGQRIF